MKELPVQLQTSIKIDKLSTLPVVLIKLINVLNDPEAGFDDIAKLIKMDVALSAKMISVANSPLYAQWGEVNNIDRVLVVLGLESVKRIIMTACITEFFSTIEPKKENLKQRLWVNSLQCAHIAQHLAKIIGYNNPDMAYLTGLLHRLGQLIFLHSFQADYIEKVMVSGKLEDQLVNERKHYGWSQAELGSWLIEQWRFDPLLSDAVLYQTASDEAIVDAHLLIKLINLASKLTRNPESESLSLLGNTLFGLTEEVMQSAFEQSKQEVIVAAKTFGFSLDNGNDSLADLEKQRLGLARIIHNNALLENSRLPLQQSSGLEELLIASQRNLKIVFGISNSCFFLLNSEGTLQGWKDQDADNKISQLQLSADSTHSLISRSVGDKKSYNSASTTENIISVVDQQVIRALACDQIIAFPLLNNDLPLGVLVVGFQEKDQQFTPKKLQLLTIFSMEVSSALSQSTRLKEEQKNLQQAAQAEFSLKARKVVHEINNPLSIMRNYLHALGTKLDQEHPAHNELNLIADEVQRVGDILLHFSQSAQLTDEFDSKRMDVNELIIKVCKLFEESLFRTQGIQLEYHFEKQLPSLDIDAGKMKQVLINLLKNAAEAIPKNGLIEIFTAGNLMMDKKTYLEIRIRDNGPGIPAEILNNLFSPVVSTKGKEHSGLGLAISANLIKEMNGKIHCKSNDKGAEFQILLPFRS